jgi:hypothetical protein
MIRAILTEAALFATPFVVYVLYLWGTRAGVLHIDSWPLRRLVGLVGVALVLMASGVYLFMQETAAPPHSNYVPAHMENGRLVPGTMQ